MCTVGDVTCLLEMLHMSTDEFVLCIYDIYGYVILILVLSYLCVAVVVVGLLTTCELTGMAWDVSSHLHHKTSFPYSSLATCPS